LLLEEQNPDEMRRLEERQWGRSLVWKDQPAGCSPSQFTVHQTSQTVFFSRNKLVGTVFFSQVSYQRTGPLRISCHLEVSAAVNTYLSFLFSPHEKN